MTAKNPNATAREMIGARVPRELAQRVKEAAFMAKVTTSEIVETALREWFETAGSLDEFEARRQEAARAVTRRVARRNILLACGILKESAIEGVLDRIPDEDEDRWRRALVYYRQASGKPELQQWTPEEQEIVKALGVTI